MLKASQMHLTTAFVQFPNFLPKFQNIRHPYCTLNRVSFVLEKIYISRYALQSHFGLSTLSLALMTRDDLAFYTISSGYFMTYVYFNRFLLSDRS